MQKLLDFLSRLKEERITHTIERNTPDALMVLIAVPGERWEVEFFADGHVEVEVFTSGGVDRGDEHAERLFERFGEEPAE